MDSPSEEKDQHLEDSSTSELSDTENDAGDSSNSETSEKEPTTFDVVMNAIKPEGEDDDETENSSEDDDSEETDDKGEDGKASKDKSEETNDDDEPSKEELKLLKPKTRKRFKDLQAKHRTMTEERDALKERIDKAEVEAGYYKQFTTFLDDNRISQDEANELFSIGALMKNDPQRALELMTPHYKNLLHLTGNVLPADLEYEVNQGYMTKDKALELSRLRMSGKVNQDIQKEKDTQHQHREVVRQQNHINSMQTAIADWEKNWSTSDPDYSVKKDRVQERVELTLARASRDGTLPQTVEKAVELANKAKADVEAELRQFRPKKAIKTVDGGSSSSSMPVPKDTSDVIRRALNQ